jgi:hypothetical protein
MIPCVTASGCIPWKNDGGIEEDCSTTHLVRAERPQARSEAMTEAVTVWARQSNNLVTKLTGSNCDDGKTDVDACIAFIV